MTRKHIVIDARIRRSSTGRYVDRLLEHLQTVDTFHTFTVLLHPGDPWLPTAPNFHPLPCPYAQFSLNPLQQIGFARQLYRLKPDLVHFTMTQQPLFYFGNIVTTTHDLTMFNFVRRGTTPLLIFKFKMWAYRFLFHWSHWKSKKIIVPTQFVAEDLAIYQPTTKNRIEVTYEASEPALATRAVRPSFINTNDRFIMYLGNAFPHKNLSKLVDAFNILHTADPELKLILVGKKEVHYQELETYCSQQPSAENIYITGFLPDEEAKWLYEHCQAYVFPSLSEGFGLPALEAMAHGAIVVSSNASCLPEVYGSAAHYFDATKPADIAQKVTEALHDTVLRDKLVKASRQQLKKYSWHKMAEETLLVYKEALEETVDA